MVPIFIVVMLAIDIVMMTKYSQILGRVQQNDTVHRVFAIAPWNNGEQVNLWCLPSRLRSSLLRIQMNSTQRQEVPCPETEVP